MAVSGATDLGADDWMQTDFLTLKAVFSSCAIVEQRWLSSFTEEETLAACVGMSTVLYTATAVLHTVSIRLSAVPYLSRIHKFESLAGTVR